MQPPGLPPHGSYPAASGGAARRLAIVVVGVLAVAALAVAVSISLLGSTTSWLFLVTVAGGLVGFVAGLTTTLFLRAPHTAERAREWVAGRGWVADRDSDDDHYLAQEIEGRWREAAEGAGLGRLVFAPTGHWIRVPNVLRVQLRPYTRLTVRLWAGQLISDVAAAQDRLRELMKADGIRMERLAPDVVTIELWGGEYGPRLSIHDLT
jgi:hypothetical protein